MKPNFETMTIAEAKAYLLANRDDQKAVEAYFDKINAGSERSKYHDPEDNISEAISEYIEKKKQKEAS